MRLAGTLALGTLAAGVALAYYVQRKRQAEGVSVIEAVLALPGDARRLAATVQRRADQAVRDGIEAARVSERDLARRLEAAGAASEPSPWE